MSGPPHGKRWWTGPQQGKKNTYNLDVTNTQLRRNDSAIQAHRSLEESDADDPTAGVSYHDPLERFYARWDTLSFREREVDALLCLAYDRKQIAAKLSITTETVKSHIDSIFEKLDVRTIKHLVALHQYLKMNMAEWWDQTHQ